MAKKILRGLCILFGGALIINGVCMVIFANSTTGSYLTILLGLMFFIPAMYPKILIKITSSTAGRFAVGFVTLMCLVVLVITSSLYIYGNADNITYNEDYLIILGCGVRGTEPTEPLRSRLDTALSYLEKNNDCKIIVSGGQGRGEDISEAEAMKTYLKEHGVSDLRIITEDKSTSTSENFKFSNKEVNYKLSGTDAAFITNDFHIYRANSLARMQGFSFTHMGAPTSWYNIFPSYLRELLAIVKMLVLGY